MCNKSSDQCASVSTYQIKLYIVSALRSKYLSSGAKKAFPFIWIISEIISFVVSNLKLDWNFLNLNATITLGDIFEMFMVSHKIPEHIVNTPYCAYAVTTNTIGYNTSTPWLLGWAVAMAFVRTQTFIQTLLVYVCFS